METKAINTTLSESLSVLGVSNVILSKIRYQCRNVDISEHFIDISARMCNIIELVPSEIWQI